MEGYSKITYKDKMVCKVDYSIFKNSPERKDKTLKLLLYAAGEWSQQPAKSVLSLVNVNGLYFDMETLNTFKECKNKTATNEKKMALLGVSGLVKAAYNFVIGLTNKDTKAFDNEQEALEWLVTDSSK